MRVMKKCNAPVEKWWVEVWIRHPAKVGMCPAKRIGEDRLIVDLRDDKDFGELCRDRRFRGGLLGGLRHQRHACAAAADFKAERKPGHRTPGTVIDPAGFRFAIAPGVGRDVDLGRRIEPERAPRGGGNHDQNGHDEKQPKGAPARREGHIGHAATCGQ